jgi:gamma-F420-2:alpha-L-glutamate ligase
MMRIAAKGQFKANVHQGGSVKPVKISAQVEWLVLETVKIIGLDIAGVDLLIDKQTYKICEVNSSPGFEVKQKKKKHIDINFSMCIC